MADKLSRVPWASARAMLCDALGEPVDDNGGLVILAERVRDRIKAALDAAEYGGFDGEHHKMWAIDQMVRALTGDGYDEWVRRFKDGEDGPETYGWDEGIAP